MKECGIILKVAVTALCVFLSIAQACTQNASEEEKPRVIVTTDGEINDECSLVRFLLYTNEWDVEGIITSSSKYHWHGHKWAGDDWAQPYLDAYAGVWSNLVKHDPGYPSPDYLKSITLLGNVETEGEMDSVTPGSQHIIKILLDESDDRPVWIQAWGGWGGRYVRVRENTWLDPVAEPGYRYPEGRCYGNSAWGRERLRANIPGDTLLLEYLKPIWRWADAFQIDFAASSDWCMKTNKEANHPPVVRLNSAEDLKARPGEKVKLSARGTRNPDGVELTYHWQHHRETGSRSYCSVQCSGREISSYYSVSHRSGYTGAYPVQTGDYFSHTLMDLTSLRYAGIVLLTSVFKKELHLKG